MPTRPFAGLVSAGLRGEAGASEVQKRSLPTGGGPCTIPKPPGPSVLGQVPAVGPGSWRVCARVDFCVFFWSLRTLAAAQQPDMLETASVFLNFLLLIAPCGILFEMGSRVRTASPLVQICRSEALRARQARRDL